MDIYLHIGTGKTGTTSIQTFLELNRQKLEENGVIVPQSPGRRNHRRLTMYALNDGIIDNTRRSRGLLRDDQVAHFREQFSRQFREEAATWSGASKVILTSEQMTRLRRPGEIQRLRELIAVGSKVVVIVYFRRQDDYFLSEYSQIIKGGQNLTMDAAIEKVNMQVYNYYAFLKNWADEFGKDNIVVRPFEHSQMVGGDAVQDFLSVVGIEDLPQYAKPPRQNLSLDRYTVEYLRRLNPHVPRFIDNAPNPLRVGLVEALESVSDGAKLTLSKETAEIFLRRFKKLNALVAREYLNRVDGVLFHETPADAVVDSSALDEEKVMAITARLWAHMRKTSSQA
jgi:hypothetical protein